MKKQVWLNLNTGEFSNSWEKPEEEDSVVGRFLEETGEEANKQNWKLIEYECINDADFSFYHMMQIITSKQ